MIKILDLSKDNLQKITLLAIAYFISGIASFSVSVSHEIVTLVIFAAEGFALGFILRFGPQLWPGVFFGQLALALYNGLSLDTSLAISAINSIEAVIAYRLFSRFQLHADLKRLKDYVGLVLLIFLVLQVFSATLGVSVLYLKGIISNSAIMESWFFWWFGNSLGQLLIAPVILGLKPAMSERWQVGKTFAVVIYIAVFSLAEIFLLKNNSISITHAVYTPLFIIIAIFTHVAIVSIGMTIFTGIYLIGIIYQHGPFINNGQILLMQFNLFLTGLILTSQFVAIVFTERETDKKQLKLLNNDLEGIVTQRTAELEKSKQEAEIANIEKSRFLANMSHELRTPLHAIISFAKLGQKTITDNKSSRYLANIQTSGKRLQSLIDDLLDIAKLESGKMQPLFGEVDLNIIINKAFTEVTPLLKEKKQTVQLEPINPGICIADEKLIMQVLINILSNAIEFSPENSRITISNSLHKHEIDTIEIRITDQGIGIPEEQLDSIFERYEQSSRTRSNAGGTGLGLFICQQIIMMHNGRIWAESPPHDAEKGSSFYLRLPVNAQAFQPQS
jgi:signal transduction histidine kinase